jgi:diaminohydroxyphosphoribosylaminopyrimidine deaminase / 5-amino-6-(5-phosphoribosylamino)uracil reductase
VNEDTAFMRRALELAHLGLGGTHPNPLVGSVVVRDGVIVGEGWHARHGAAHGEVNALRAAGEAAAGATLYVTLEPCAHHGRTPPCTTAIIDAGVRRVVYAAEDPNPKAAGGAAVLRAAGIEVAAGVEQSSARRVNALFFHVHEQHTPWVGLKLAMSLDGGIAAAPGHRTQLTGDAAQVVAHRLRAAHDAVLVGSGTVRADDPILNVRLVETDRQPLRIVIDTNAALGAASNLAATAKDGDVVVVCADDVARDRLRDLEGAGIRTLPVPRGPHGIDLDHALQRLHDTGVRSILVEGGARLADSLLTAGRIHRLHLFIAPHVLGADAVPAFSTAGVTPAWHCVRAEALGQDALLTFDPPERS